MDEKFRQLIELGAGEFEHVDGSLIAHLEGTRCLLKEWNAADVLQDAGLYHAAYGTSAFTPKVFDLTQRDEVAAVIGSAAENIVYHYCACDRDAFFSQFGQVDKPLFYDRISNKKSLVSNTLLQQLCELTAANETEIAINNPDFVTQHGVELVDLFKRMQHFLSPCSQRKIQHVFTSHI
ncbi:DUF6817 domain-containing protein [uncultured Paraglaciecola sp.]|uniref:DUF6817 domain-containing protein n=1 Tax=uncultured Paraglaciecola sp. TaxID=1765024 RepID=UPI0030DAE378|tara:strand:- start:167652 stop:168188 length:537 start_codon:yes stop_codon:yes gene_type:complete